MPPAQRSFRIFYSGTLSAIFGHQKFGYNGRMFWGFPKCTSSAQVKISGPLSNTNYLPKTLIYSTIHPNRERPFSGLKKWFSTGLPFYHFSTLLFRIWSLNMHFLQNQCKCKFQSQQLNKDSFRLLRGSIAAIFGCFFRMFLVSENVQNIPPWLISR